MGKSYYQVSNYDGGELNIGWILLDEGQVDIVKNLRFDDNFGITFHEHKEGPLFSISDRGIPEDIVKKVDEIAKTIDEVKGRAFPGISYLHAAMNNSSCVYDTIDDDWIASELVSDCEAFILSWKRCELSQEQVDDFRNFFRQAFNELKPSESLQVQVDYALQGMDDTKALMEDLDFDREI